MRRATPDFFGHQRAARRRTVALLVWFGIALGAVVALVYLALALPLVLTSAPPRLWFPQLLAFVAVAVLGTTLAGCIYHAVTLARGGPAAIVSALGATRVDPATGAADERRLVNVVEEMAIASGLPVPEVFVLRQEDGINALAAGSPGHGAVVAVTAGALAQLSRDELQGVVAHEFSHVLNGDAVLNARLLGMLGGLTIIDLFGRESLRLAWSVGRVGRAALIAVPMGLVLAAAGSIGVLCGQLVRCGVSRQREYLADAAAAQLTRNPGALARALAKIRDGGSALRRSRALEASHFFFANAMGGAFGRWLATHPPLDERIRRLDPAALRPSSLRVPERAAAPSPPATPAAALLASIGAPQPLHLDRAAELLATLPPAVSTAAHDAGAAGPLVLSLALARDAATRRTQLGWLETQVPSEAAQAVALAGVVDGLGREQRLVAVDVALATLRAATPERQAALRERVAGLPGGDGAPTVFEWMLRRVALRGLSRASATAAAPARFRAVSQVEVEALQLLSLVAWSGTRDAAAAQSALDAGARELGVGGWRPLAREKLGVEVADAALAQLERAAPEVKRKLLRACAAAVVTDARVTAPEAELLRALSASLGCPMPPVLPGALGPDSVDSREWRTAMPK